ncbi:hypothetical protein ASE11_13930 [Hydrogenophaga sp. Root209]|uniref:MASE3 domain-containing protein n=1 Tax=Hydrogenophaga sp. Root209 TaxID=1736490 RepID=UPI0006FCF797|nr:MASE3 domain-containing protein [Hydrogenophaga sp. Root209]KRB97913.1 hypothetical protein ASE11_13930 [Hydrogenophaga sp. Root209]
MTTVEVRGNKEPLSTWIICGVAVLGLLLLMMTHPGMSPVWLTSRMLAVHTILELFAILISGLVVASAWHTLDRAKQSNAQVFIVGFLVVMACDVMHVLTYKGMPAFVTESSTPQAIFFWLMGRSAEMLTLAAIAFSVVLNWSHLASLAVALMIASGLVLFGSFGLEYFPATFVQGKGVTPFKAGYEYVLSASNFALALMLWRQARREASKEKRLLGLSSFLMGLGGMAFTQYTAPSDIQNIAGHLYKVAAYALLYRAIFITSIRAPFDALQASEAVIRKNQERMRTLGANLINSVIYQVTRSPDGDLRYTEVSDSIERICGVSAAELHEQPKRWAQMVIKEDQRLIQAAEKSSLESLCNFDVVVRMLRGDGTQRHMHFVAAPRRRDDGAIVWDGVATDITERIEADERRKTLEAQLNQAQKMESIGTLASGIAHDFNNVLAAILGNANMAIEDVQRGEKGEALVGLAQIRKSGSRARALVNQILSFGRREALFRSVQPVRPIIEEAITLLRSTIPRNVTLDERLDDQNACALIDRTQIEQVLLNLCTNAWHAIGDKGGRIAVSSSLVSVSATAAPIGALLPGRYVQIRVEDNGCGMDDATRRRIFEPFFTTKSPGKGTGLGLSVVHGIVSSHDGAITLESSLGRGTTFDVFLPACDCPQASVASAVHEGMPNVMGNGERVLYVDDDVVMALMVERLLKRARFDVSVVHEPNVASILLKERPDAYDVLVTDYNMPGLSGLELIQAARVIRPDLPAILISGYVSEELRELCQRQNVGVVLEKQKSLDELTAAIERCLEGTR